MLGGPVPPGGRGCATVDGSGSRGGVETASAAAQDASRSRIDTGASGDGRADRGVGSGTGMNASCCSGAGVVRQT